MLTLLQSMEMLKDVRAHGGCCTATSCFRPPPPPPPSFPSSSSSFAHVFTHNRTKLHPQVGNNPNNPTTLFVPHGPSAVMELKDQLRYGHDGKK